MGMSIEREVKDREMDSLVAGFKRYYDLVEKRDEEIKSACQAILDKYEAELDTLDKQNIACLQAHVAKYGQHRAEILLDLLCCNDT